MQHKGAQTRTLTGRSTPASAGNQAAMEVYGYLFETNTDLDIPVPANQEPPPAPAPGGCLACPESVPATEITLSSRFPITDAAGDINGNAVKENDILAVSIRRDLDNTQGVADNTGGDIRVLSSVRIYQIGV